MSVYVFYQELESDYEARKKDTLLRLQLASVLVNSIFPTVFDSVL